MTNAGFRRAVGIAFWVGVTVAATWAVGVTIVFVHFVIKFW